MARLFDDAIPQYLHITTAGIPTNEPLSIVAWANTNNLAIFQQVLALGNNGSAGRYGLEIRADQAGDKIIATKQEDGGSAANAASATGVSVNTWHHMAAVFRTNTSRDVYLDGGSKGSNATSIADPTVDLISIGILKRPSPAIPLSGLVAEAAVYDIALSDAEIALLGKGFSPLFIRPENLVAYWPLIRDDDNDLVGDLNLTAVGSPTVSTHPPAIIHPILLPTTLIAPIVPIVVFPPVLDITMVMPVPSVRIEKLTPTELGYLRDDHPHKIVPYLSVLTPSVVYVGTMNGVHDRGAREITVTDVSGTLSDSIAGMTILVGTTTGDYSISRRRFRSRSGQVIKLDENSVAWSVGDTLTIVENWELWPVYPYIDTSDYTFFKDRDIVYTDQNEAVVPVAIAGTHRAGFLENGTITFELDASDSYVMTSVGGATISTYLWTCTGGSIADSGAAATTITFTVPGQYWLRLRVTDSEGQTQNTRRAIFVHDRTGANSPFLDFNIQTLRGDWGSGGWEVDVRVFGNATLDEIPQGALIVIWAETWYGDSKINIGSTNEVLFAGYIRGESIKKELDTGDIVFQAHTINRLMDEARMYSVSLEYTDSPTKWYHYKNLTTTRAVHHFWRYHSTLFRITDVYLPTDDTKLLVAVDDFENGSLYSMVESFVAEHGIFAHICCNKGGQLRMEREVNMINDSDRSSVASIFTITDQDRKGRTDVEIIRDPIGRTSHVMLSGTRYDGTNVKAICTQAPGNVSHSFGNIIVFDRIVLSNKANARYLVGKIFKISNREIIELRIQFAGNYLQILDISLQEFVVVSLTATDTKRGIVIDNDKYIVRNITASFSVSSGVVSVSAVLEPEIVDGTNGVFWLCVGDPAYVHPSDDDDDWEIPPLPPWPPPPPPPVPPLPPPPAPDPEAPNVAFVMSQSQLARSKNFNVDSPNWTNILPSGATGKLLRFNVSQADHSAVLFETKSRFGVVWHTADVLANTPVWTKLADDTIIQDAVEDQMSGVLTIAGVGFAGPMDVGVMLTNGTIQILVRWLVNSDSGGFPYNHHINFLLTYDGSGWIVNYFEFENSIYTMQGHSSWHIDVDSGYMTGHETRSGNQRGAAKWSGEGEGGVIQVPEFGISQSTGIVLIDGTYFILSLTDKKIYTSADAGATAWVEYAPATPWPVPKTGLTKSSQGTLFYIKSLLASGGNSHGIFANNALLKSSADIFGSIGEISHVIALTGDDGRFGGVAYGTGYTPKVFWVEYDTVLDKTGDLSSAIGVWVGGDSNEGNAMLIVLDGYI